MTGCGDTRLVVDAPRRLDLLLVTGDASRESGFLFDGQAGGLQRLPTADKRSRVRPSGFFQLLRRTGASPDYSSYEGKASHTVNRGASLGASGHPSEKHADVLGAWL
jgi:hypothetical protein